ncbi:SMC_N domain-containing protein [Haematococcus lacustris]|uniref:SMC_N domain-containing protein n=1 Tax=Haematococcus lacustris TaxID=44745 RepID=A0A6A0A699_HAELA|nr:SMC_N domain-containing protein [Haematococcus lacustris]
MSFTEVQLNHALTLQPISTKRRAVALVEQPSASRPRIEAGPSQPSLHHEAGAALETPAISLRNEGLPGQLKSICVVNFMCHAHFALEFGPHVTLVSGTNGSGKSAVIQGLQVCLGLKARETRRGDNLQSFIKTGCEEAKVQVTLWNKGDDAYEPAIFGEQITIERRLTRKASNPFKLVDERNKTVSVSRSSIDAVLEYFNINAANPLTIVTQDMARDFNSGGSADRQKKYTMYMEGTLLFDIQKELSDAAAELGKAKEDVDGLLLDKNEASAEVQKMTGKRELCEGLEKQRDIQAALENHMAWLEAYAARSTVQQLQQELDQKLPEQLQQLNQLEAEVQAKLETIKQDIHTKMEAAEQAQETISRHRAQIQDLSEQARLAGRERLAAQREVDDCKATVAEVEQELQVRPLEFALAALAAGQGDVGRTGLRAWLQP